MFAATLLLLAAVVASGPLDLAALVEEQCGPEGWHPQSACTVELERGDFTIGETVLGDCNTSQGIRQNLRLRGQGDGAFASVPAYATAGTVLRYGGAPGGTMLELCGSHIDVSDLAFEGTGAGVVIRRTANNLVSALSHHGILERITIQSGGIGVEWTGRNADDQLDFQVLRDSNIRNVETCFVHDNQQAALNKVENVDCASTKVGYVVRSGSVHFERAYIGQLRRADGSYDPEFVGHLFSHSRVGSASMTAHDSSIRDTHLEIHVGRYFVQDTPSHYPVRVEGGKILLLGESDDPIGRKAIVFDVTSRAPWIVDGLTLASSRRALTPVFCNRGPGLLVVRNAYYTRAASTGIWECE